jgi:large subunit ribosomal protein L25
MSKQGFEIDVASRPAGKTSARAARKVFNVPGVIYGPKMKNMPIQAPERILRKYISHAFDNTIFKIKSEDKDLNGVSILMKHKDVHPITRRLTHVDFYALDLTKTIKVSIELKFTGKPRGIADGGFFQPIERTIEIECLPNAIPESFEVDTTDLGVHESLHADKVKLPDGVKLVTDPGVTLCTVTIIKEEEVVVAPAATALAEPEVIAKGKEKEGEAGAAAADGKAAAPAAGGDKKAEKK